MKIAIYAICKNEISNVTGFLESVKEADCVRIVDTGSTDGTLAFFPVAASNVGIKDFRIEKAIFQPFNFSSARNLSLQLAEETDCDYALFVDLDERPSIGWYDYLSAVLELHADKDYNIIGTHMNLMHEGKSSTRYLQHKGHKLHASVTWKYSAHEIFVYPEGIERNLLETDIEFYHTKDENKVRTYLPLLKEDFGYYPNDHRCIFYYGRELYYAGEYKEALEVLGKANANSHGYFVSQHLELLLCMYQCSKNAAYLYEAVAVNQLSPDIYYELALHHYLNNNFNAGIGYIELMFRSINQDNLSNYGVMFKDASKRTWRAYDIMSNCYWNLDDLPKAVFTLAKALESNPTEDRLLRNMAVLKKLAEKDNTSADSTEPT